MELIDIRLILEKLNHKPEGTIHSHIADYLLNP